MIKINSDNELFNQIFKFQGDTTKQSTIVSGLKDINLKDKRGFTILHYACISGDIELVEVLIKTYKAEIDETNLDKQTALHLAINTGYMNIAKYLVKQGSDIFIKSSSGQNVLHYAAYHGESEFIKWLFEEYTNDYQKGKVNSKSGYGMVKLHYTIVHFIQTRKL